MDNIASLDGLLDCGVFQLGKVLAGESEDAGGVLGGESNVVGGAGLVSIGGAPDHAIWQGAEVGEGLDRLVSRTVLTKTNAVVGSDPDDPDLAVIIVSKIGLSTYTSDMNIPQRRETNGARG